MVIHAALRRETLRKSQRPQHKELWARKEQNARHSLHCGTVILAPFADQTPCQPPSSAVLGSALQLGLHPSYSQEPSCWG